jgi:hypothetical protein
MELNEKIKMLASTLSLTNNKKEDVLLNLPDIYYKAIDINDEVTSELINLHIRKNKVKIRMFDKYGNNFVKSYSTYEVENFLIYKSEVYNELDKKVRLYEMYKENLQHIFNLIESMNYIISQINKIGGKK